MLAAGCRAVHRRPQPPPVPACEQLRSTGKICSAAKEIRGATPWAAGRDMSSKYKETSTGGLAVNVSVNYVEC